MRLTVWINVVCSRSCGWGGGGITTVGGCVLRDLERAEGQRLATVRTGQIW